MQLPEPDFLPEWAKFIAATAFGAGGVKMLSVWLENRRLGRKDYQEAMSARIRDLEQSMSLMQVRMGNLRVEAAHLEVENRHLKRKIAELEHPEHADQEEDGGADEQPR